MHKYSTREFFSVFNTAFLQEFLRQKGLRISYVILAVDDIFDTFSDLSRYNELYGNSALSSFIIDFGKITGHSRYISSIYRFPYKEIADNLSDVIGRKISYINISHISQDQSRKKMKDRGINDWFINTTIELYDFCKGGNLSAVSSAVEEITGEKQIPFSQFAKDYVEAFK
jgi:hypothetical protein